MIQKNLENRRRFYHLMYQKKWGRDPSLRNIREQRILQSRFLIQARRKRRAKETSMGLGRRRST